MGICNSKSAQVIDPLSTQEKAGSTGVPLTRNAPPHRAVDKEDIPKPLMTASSRQSLSEQNKSSSGSSVHTSNTKSKEHGYSSGASTPSVLDASAHSIGDSKHLQKGMKSSTSILGLDNLINDRKADGDLKNNIVHMEVPFGKPIEEVYDGIHDGDVLGSGISGLVRLCVHKTTGVKYAVKCLDLGLIETEEGIQQLREEIAIMCQLDHPNIVRLEEVYEGHSEIYLVQELCTGGELFDRLDEQPDYHYSEAQCAKLVKEMLCSVRYIHSKGIIHRDLKLENFLFSTGKADSELKMIDFGLSKHFKYGEVQHDAVGTPYTVAPEVIRGSYEERCDVWAIGVITYLLLSGDPPFGGCGGPESLMQVRSNILAGRFRFEPIDVWQSVSAEAKDFIRMLLVTDPRLRPTAKQCQKSAWLHEWANRDRKDGDNHLNTHVVKALVNFKEYSDMRKLLCEVLSFTLLPDQITDLRKEFEKLDIDGSGEISLKGLKQVLMQGAGSGTLGALTEEEVEDIFNAMRVRKTETRIHWHEFIAAGLSQCQVDDRNLRLAFDRLDADHKGFVTFDNIMDMMGRDGADSEDKMKDMWASSMKACKCNDTHITYSDFLLLMKGQTMQPKEHKLVVSLQAPVHPHPPSTLTPSFLPGMPIAGGNLEVLHELSDTCSTDEYEEETSEDGPHISKRDFLMPTKSLPSVFENTFDRMSDDMDLSPGMDIDDDEGFDEMISQAADKEMLMKINLTPPQSPVRSPTDFVTPTGVRFGSPNSLELSTSLKEKLPDLPSSIDFSRRRSKSVDDSDYMCEDNIVPDSRRAMPLPEHTHDTQEIESAINDDKLTPLVMNRKLYRAHRQMRLAVFEASKRFEDQQLQRTKAELQAKHDADSSNRFGAGLVMRRGLKKELSTDAIRQLMTERQHAHQSMVENAARRGGRGRRARKKTVSDMSGMLLAIPAKDLAIDGEKTQPNQSIIGLGPQETERQTPELNLKLHDLTKPEPTIPGVFRKTFDPFGTLRSSLNSVAQYTGNTNKNTEGQQTTNSITKSNSAIKVSVSDGELNSKLPDSP